MITTPKKLFDLLSKTTKDLTYPQVLSLMQTIVEDTEHIRYKIENEDQQNEKILVKCVKTEKNHIGCDEWKPIEEFGLNRGHSDRKNEPVRCQSYCKKCYREQYKNKDAQEVIAETTENAEELSNLTLEKAKASLVAFETGTKLIKDIIDELSYKGETK